MQKQKGNILFLILIAVALFAALSYAVTGISRTTGNTIESEKAKLTQGEIDSYTAAMNTGINRLKLINNCSIIDYTPPADQTAGDKSCHLFHPDGGAVSYRDLALGLGCPLTDLAVGEVCNGVVYAGSMSGNRLYTTQNDLGLYSWNDGTVLDSVQTNIVSLTNGAANTTSLVNYTGGSEPYQAAIACRNLGSEWYLPGLNELLVLNANKGAIGNFYTGTAPQKQYWSSSENSAIQSKVVNFNDDTNSTPGKGTALSVRCTRRD